MNFWYLKRTKIIGNILQGLLAGLVVLCALFVLGKLTDSPSLMKMRQSFEQTDMFYETVEELVQDKVNYQKNKELFERDGAFDQTKQIDIRQYVDDIYDQTSLNSNTTYTIESLLKFDSSGDSSRMSNRLRSMMEQGASENEIGSALAAQASELETVLPVSGSLLSEYANIGSNPNATLVEYYRDLCETSSGLAKRYKQYKSDTENENSENDPQAPSNLLYYVEDSGTGSRYTNLPVKSLIGARMAAKGTEGMEVLFEGERRFNIMVADEDNTRDDRAQNWFIHSRFSGNSEKIMIAVDMGFPVSDRLQTTRTSYQKLRPMMAKIMVLAVILALALVFLLIMSIITTGETRISAKTLRRSQNGLTRMKGQGYGRRATDGKMNKLNIHLDKFDSIPTEIAGGLCLIIIIGWWIIGSFLRSHVSSHRLSLSVLLPIICMVEYELCLQSLLSLVRRIKAGTLWPGSVIYTLILGTRVVVSARKRSQRLLIAYAVIVLLSTIFLLLGRLPGWIMFVTLNMAVLLYLMRDAVGNQNVREGLAQISKGELDYKINTQVLTGESREMGEAVNEMGDGLKKAVDSMISNERLKAELITNVSHDLKTPLTSIINYVDLLKREDLANVKALEYIDILEQKATRLKTLTEDLIEVSKISSGNVELHPQMLVFQSFLMQACGEFEDRLEEKGLTCKYDLPRTPVRITADGRQLFRVMENVLSNIVKYAKADTQVDIVMKVNEGESATGTSTMGTTTGSTITGTTATGASAMGTTATGTSATGTSMVTLTFTNRSAVPITVSAQQLQERFSRGDASRNSEGSGLGLSIAGSLTELLGGKFDVEVTEDTFAAVLSFPVAKEPDLIG